jgi:REP element-mobilizing transposase RayT
MGKSYCNLIYHIVFSTKDRAPLLTTEHRDRIHEYLGGAIRDMGGVALAVGGTSDHVHILAKLRQDKALSDALRDLKAGTSKWIHNTFKPLDKFAWQEGYGAFSVSTSQVDKVTAYITSQESHHKTTTFQDEFVALLNVHGVEFDHRYIWE